MNQPNNSQYPSLIKPTTIEGVFQYTLDDKRWYMEETEEGILYYPAVTWILDAYPKGIGFKKWLSSLPDWETGQRILNEAGDRGSRVHWGIERLLKNETIEYMMTPNGYYLHFTPEEWECLMAFVNWFKIFKPTVINVEETILSRKHGYAGTADLICICDEGILETWNPRSNKEPEPNGNQVYCLFDWKTGLNIYENYKLQVYAYTEEKTNLSYTGIVRLGSKHKTGFEFWLSKINDKERPDYFGAFLNTFELWKHEWGNPRPLIKSAPEKLSLKEIDTQKLEVEDVAQRHDTANIG